MIKGFCINNKPIEGSFNTDLHLLKEGDTYEGYFDETVGVNGEAKIGFMIPSIDDGGWSTKRFLFLSDLDETTLVTESFEEKYCVPVNAESCK